MYAAQLSLSEFQQDELITATASTTVLDAQALTKKCGIHHLAIIEGPRVVGVICTCDLLFAPADTPLSQVMHSPVTLRTEQTAQDAILIMRQMSVGSVVLLQNDEPVGIVTRGDLLEKLRGEDDEKLIERCECCGVSQHLRQYTPGHTLCVSCHGLKLKSPAGSPPKLRLVAS